ncbi:MAG TPA: nucleotidyltransferase family protein [Gemmataceae bacterium]|nr:nucleotidyltransferase family protein [Gemmataceae bacterium]
MIYALIPAGGKSTRMGRPKLTLPLGGRSVLEHVIRALQWTEAREVLVVVGPHVPELVPLARRLGAHTLVLAEESAGMRDTVEHGLRRLEELFHPGPDDDWLLVPGDHPLLNPDVVRQLIEARRQNPERTIVLPTYCSRRGHPTLLRWKHVAGIRAHPAGEGLNTYIRQRAAETLEVPVDSPSILFDLDTPADYERLLQQWPKR